MSANGSALPANVRPRAEGSSPPNDCATMVTGIALLATSAGAATPSDDPLDPPAPLALSWVLQRAAETNPDAIYDLPDPGVWAALIILVGPISTPAYFYKTRGAGKAVVFTVLVAGLFAGFLKMMLMLLGPML